MGPRPGPARGILRRVEGRRGLHHQRLAPDPKVAEWVAHYWWVEWRLEAPHLAETIPHPSVHVVFEWPGGRVVARGPSPRRFTRELRGEGQVFGIKFRPATFSVLARRPMIELQDGAVSVSQAWGRDRLRQPPELDPHSGPEVLASSCDVWLGGWLPTLPAPVRALRDLVEQIETDQGLVRVELAAQRSGLSVRALERRFRSQVGLSPKRVIQQYRLIEAAERLKAPRPPTLVDLAAELGFFDQAHFSRAFKAITGRTPTEFLTEEGRYRRQS